MEFRIFDRLEVIERGAELPLGGSRQRVLLAVLLVHRRERVSTDQLIEALWGDSPPPTANKTIQVYVSRLRKAIGDGVLETRDHGYRLAADALDVDADRFEMLAHEGRAALDTGDARRAATRLTEALALWRGPPLGEFAYEPFARGEISRLEAERVAAIESRLSAELQLGRGRQLVPELEQLVDEHPLREGLVSALMLALYRAGRQADALAAYRAARRRLVDELGLEPGVELHELERRILDHDPSLLPRSRVIGPVTRRPVRAIAALVAAAAAVVAGLSLGAPAAGPHPAALADRDGLVTLSATSGKLLSTTALDGAPTGVSHASGSVWTAAPGTGIVSKIAPGASSTLDRISVGGEPGVVVASGGAVWTASTVGATVQRIDPATDDVTQTVALPGSSLSALAVARGRLWAADALSHKLFAIDPGTGVLVRTVALRVQPSALAIAAGALWVAGYDSGTLDVLDPVSGRELGRVRVGGGPAAITFANGALWVANSLDSTVSRVDPVARAATATIPVGSGPSAIAAAGGSVWVASRYSHEVARIDPSHNRITARFKVGGLATSLSSDGARLWVGVAADGASHRGGTLKIVTQVNATAGSALGPQAPDPAFYNFAFSPQFMGLTYDTLATFQHTDGAAGSRLVPDLAVSLPKPTATRTTYALRIRPHIRYSDGRVVHASDFRRAIERLFRVHSPGAAFFAGLLGGGSCQRSPASCDLSRGVVTDDARGTVAFRLVRPDPDFLFRLTAQAYSAPIPPTTPDREPRGRSVPGTGPYTIAGYGREEVRFVRNPYFREWAHAAQPAGNPDEVIWRSVASADAAVAEVQRGDADWFFGTIPARRYRRLALTRPSSLHVSPTFGIEFVPLNTHIAPFNDLRVRRALNYAVDRRHIVQLYGGSAFAGPACQPLAPGMPGYRRYCPYTRRPERDGVWSAPDLAAARQLVAASGTRGETIDVWGAPDEGFIPPTVPRYIASVLRELGYRVRLHMPAYASISEAMRRHFQLSVDGDWLAEYPTASSYLPQFFGCHGGTSNGYVCRPGLDREMTRAVQLGPQRPAAASALWTHIDHRLTDEAAWVPTVNEREVEVTSARLRNYQYNPVWGFLADQAWLR